MAKGLQAKKKAVAKKMSTKTTFEHLGDLVKEGKLPIKRK